MDKDVPPLAIDKYTLILYHDYIYGDQKVRLDDPVQVTVSMPNAHVDFPKAIIVNEMLDRLRIYLLSKLKEVDE